MDRNIRRALYTALVAGGLVVVGASSAYAAGEGPSDPVAQEVADTSEAVVADEAADSGAGAAATRGALDAGIGDKSGSGLVGDIVGPEGILDSLVRADVGGVVDGALGEDGLVGHLLDGVPPADVEIPEPGEPGEPGAEEPGTGPGTGGPGVTDPGTDQPGTGEPGAGDPGTGEPGTGKPGPGEPGSDQPGAAEPGSDRPGTGGPGIDRPGNGPGSTRPDADAPETGGQTGPESAAPGSGAPRGVEPVDLGAGGPDAGPGADVADSGHAAGQGLPVQVSDTTDELPDGSVDISWGGKDKKDTIEAPVYDGPLLAGGMGDNLTSTTTEPELEGDAEPVVIPGAAAAPPGHTITGQLSLISVFLGLGIAALRMRRR